MKAVVLFSGLGNQMFQYAFYKGLAAKYNDVFCITNQEYGKNQHNSEEVCDIFNINPQKNTWFYSKNILCRIYRKLLIKSGLCKVYDYNGSFDDIAKRPFEVYIGYFMDLKYFDFVRDDLIKDFTIRQKLDSKNLHIMQEITHSQSLGIHIRRGDFLHFCGGIALKMDYYKRAIDFIKARVANLNIFIFSDDLDFVNNKFIPLINNGGGELPNNYH